MFLFQANVEQIFSTITDYAKFEIFRLGDTPITPLTLLYVVIFSLIIIFVSGKLKKLIVGRVLGRTRLDIGARQAIGTIFRYVIVTVGFLVVIQTVGIDLTTLNVLAGAVGIGIGLGLQNVANNFISGLIIMFERPIKVGDRIEVGDVTGDVVEIGARSTRVRTNDSITIIVPNSKFISENVINWSFDRGIVRFRIPVSVAYSSDVDLVTKLLVDLAKANPDVLEEPAPSVRLLRFDDNAIYFELRAWSKDRIGRPGLFTSNLNYKIVSTFRKHKIEMPFPQRDLHIRSGSLEVANAGFDVRPSGNNRSK